MHTHSPSARVVAEPVELDSSRPRDGHSSSSPHLAWPFGKGERPYLPSLSGKDVLLAFDDSPEAESAARVVDAIATQLHAKVNVVSVVDTSPVPIPFPLDDALALVHERPHGTIHREREYRVRARLSVILSRPIDWPASIDLGIPAAAIARRGFDTKAALVVMGLRHHGRVDRAVHHETALSVMRKAAGPVLGVAVGAAGLPKSALVAMDFSRESVQAAATAATLMAPGGRMTFAYVQSTSMEYPDGTPENVIRSLGVESAFERLERAFASAVLRVDHIVLHRATAGMPSSLLLEMAESGGVDLLVAGSARHGRLDRVLLGSVSADLVRDGRYSVLVVPPSND
jgi:nucleotide-binding universal stress UspA family protein